MITRIQALNYRCLRHVDVTLDRFHVLVGPNASGKSTLFDVIAFVGDFIRDGLEDAIAKRTYNFQDLVWGRPTDDLGFELALEIEIPADLRSNLRTEQKFHTYRYEIAVREIENVPHVHCERGILVAGQPTQGTSQTVRRSFPEPSQPPKTILSGDYPDNSLVALERNFEGLKITTEVQISGSSKGEAPARVLFRATAERPTGVPSSVPGQESLSGFVVPSTKTGPVLRPHLPDAAAPRTVKDVALRLSGKTDRAIRQLELTYGGGKTHTLITLYHLFRDPGALPDSPTVTAFREHVGENLP